MQHCETNYSETPILSQNSFASLNIYSEKVEKMKKDEADNRAFKKKKSNERYLGKSYFRFTSIVAACENEYTKIRNKNEKNSKTYTHLIFL